MLLLNISTLYLKCGILLKKSVSFNKELENYKIKFKYIKPELNIDYDISKLFLFKLNYFKIDDFTKSPDFEFLSKFNDFQNANLEQKEKEEIEKKLLVNKNNNTILSEPTIKNKDIKSCYYNGKLNGKI